MDIQHVKYCIVFINKKVVYLIGFALIVAYLLIMYFIIDFNLPKEMLILPILLRSMGYVILATTFITALSGIPFQNFFQSLTVQSFVSACFGALLGTSILNHLFKLTMQKNFMQLSTPLDNVNMLIQHIPSSALVQSLQQQAIMVSMKEMYGWLCIIGILCLVVFFLQESTLRPKILHPKFKTMRKAIKHELRLEKTES